MRKLVCIIFFVSVFFSCNDNCDGVDTPSAPSVIIELLDVTTSENVFTLERFKTNQIIIKDEADKEVEFSVVEQLNKIHLVLGSEIIQDKNYTINLNNPDTMEEVNLSFKISTEKVEQECFTQYVIQEINFPNNENQLEDENTYQVKI